MNQNDTFSSVARKIGIFGLLTTPAVLCVDMIAGLPGLPEITFIWLVISLCVTGVSFLLQFIKSNA